MEFALKNAGMSGQLIQAGSLPKAVNLYIAFAKSGDAQTFREAYDNAFKKLIMTGQIDSVLRRYGAFRAPNQ